MNVRLALTDGLLITIETEQFNLEGYTEQLNNQNLIAINVGDSLYNKQLVKLLDCETTATPNMMLHLTDETRIKVFIEDDLINYVESQINDPRVMFVKAGDVTFNKNYFKMLTKIHES